ncbi:MAG: KTSC domain-containing protein [Hydrogenophaga sp.]|nr:KTSC domain-containing protein [Hydrogenophaga sp.]
MSKFKPAAAFSETEYVAITMNPVVSNQIAAIGFSSPITADAAPSDAFGTLAVTFTRGTGAVYHYPGVSRATYDAFMAAESKDKFFGQHIKNLPFDKFPASAAKPAEDKVEEAADTAETATAEKEA